MRKTGRSLFSLEEEEIFLGAVPHTVPYRSVDSTGSTVNRPGAASLEDGQQAGRGSGLVTLTTAKLDVGGVTRVNPSRERRVF